MQEYDLVIIGSGGGAKLLAAAKLGHKVAIVEKGPVGGTCLNRGCIPSKMLIHLADKLESMEHLKDFYVHLKDPEYTFDWERFLGEVSAHVDQTSANIAAHYEKDETVDFYRGEARFVGEREVEISLCGGNEKLKMKNEKLRNDVKKETVRIKGKKVLVATGARPMIPEIKGLAGTPYMTSTEALRLEKKPKKLLIIGGGYIAVELGHFYKTLGVEVEYLVRSQLLKEMDKDIAKEFDQKFCSKNKVHKGVTPVKVEYRYGQFFVHGKKKESGDRSQKSEVFVGDGLLLATGVVPNSDMLDLGKTGVKRNNRGFIQVNDHLETDCPGVYAIGDVVGNYLFRHSVNFEAEYLLDQLYLGKEKAPISYPPMPSAVFSSPQVASVGVREQDLLAGKQGSPAETGQAGEGAKPYVAVSHRYGATGMGKAMREDGLVKILADKETGKLLGAHIIGPKASDIIHSLIAQMTVGMTVEECLKMIYIHPALSEVVKGALRKAVVALDAGREA